MTKHLIWLLLHCLSFTLLKFSHSCFFSSSSDTLILTIFMVILLYGYVTVGITCAGMYIHLDTDLLMQKFKFLAGQWKKGNIHIELTQKQRIAAPDGSKINQCINTEIDAFMTSVCIHHCGYAETAWKKQRTALVCWSLHFRKKKNHTAFFIQTWCPHTHLTYVLHCRIWVYAPSPPIHGETKHCSTLIWCSHLFLCRP